MRMPKHYRPIAGVFVALLVAGWFMTTGNAAWAEAPAAPSVPDSVAASCYGPSCAGLDPESHGCSADAVTLASIVILGASAREFLVEHRYSSACYASWTRISNRASNPDCLIGTVAFHQGWWTDGHLSRTPTVAIGPSCSGWTKMMSEHNKSTRACGYSGWEGQSRCTGWKLPG